MDVIHLRGAKIQKIGSMRDVRILLHGEILTKTIELGFS